MARERWRRPVPLGTRGATLMALLLFGAWAWVHLDLSLGGLVPHAGGLEIARGLFARALTPAFTSEAEYVPEGAPPLLVLAAGAAWRTLTLASAAMGISILIAAVLGVGASASWWRRGGRAVRGAPLAYGASRALIAGMRSIHEVLWAVLFLAAFGLSEFSAVLAIAIPYGGTLAKIWSELLDEAPRDTGDALRAAGACEASVFAFGLVPRALPDMVAYTFYRYECALRSSAVLGFFGFETLGLYVRQSFNASNYGEVWTFLYASLVLIVAFDAWSGVLRRSIVA